MFILLPPSEGKSSAQGSASFRDRHSDEFPATEKILRHAQRLTKAERMKFHGLKDAQKCAIVHEKNMACLDAGVLPALERYTGVVYQYLDPPTLRHKAYARKHILVVSAMFGLVDGNTGVPDYKLSMNPWLARYWKTVNAARLHDRTAGKPVLNLLSQTYAKAIDAPHAISVDFKVSGGKKSAGHFGKAIKGKFARWVVENKISEQKDFDRFTEENYRWDGEDFIQS